MEELDYFVDDNGHKIVEDPQHGQCIDMGPATEEELMLYLDSILLK